MKIGNKLDFAQNVNVLGSPPGLKNFISQNYHLVSQYPEQKSADVIKALSKFLNVKEISVCYVNGSTEAFFNLPIFLNQPKALIVQPSFWEYEVANKKAGKKIQSFLLSESNDFKLDWEKFSKEFRNDMAVYLCNPNNPTSRLIYKNEILKTVKESKKTIFVVDETYLIFRDDYKKLTLTKEAQNLKNLYVIGSLSKIFSLSGIRAGFMVSHTENISRYIESKIPYEGNTLGSNVIRWALMQKDYLIKTRNFYKRARKDFFKLLSEETKNKLFILEAEANFILAKILTSQTSTEITKDLAKKGILVRDGAELPYLNNKWIRFTVNKPEHNKRLISIMKEILK